MTNLDLEQRVHELELRLAAAESMTDILVNEAREQRGLEPIDWERMRADAKAAVDDALATVLGALGVEHTTAPSLSEQLREARATIQRQTLDALTDKEMYDDAMAVLHNCGQRRREADRAVERVRRLAVRWRGSGNASYMSYGEDVLAALDGER